MTPELRVYGRPDDVIVATGSYEGYPEAWCKPKGEAIKDLIRELAGHRCVRCGHPYRTGESPPEWSPCDELCTHGGPIRWRQGPDQEWVEQDRAGDLDWYPEVEAKRRVLTTHHLNGIKIDCRWWNLIALCQRCHLTIQGRVKLERVWSWEHTDWFKPYVAGFYAFSYLGEDLTRDETESRLDELLALERAVA